ncbi:MAG: DUF6249 domain-containing protein [Muribaculum sp.]|nr:DUF6249 domain-containing protein [Muribaculaceae bacterium]MCM1080682.1 DUF6249 domain-containing protein [Muribaculum sp.]
MKTKQILNALIAMIFAFSAVSCSSEKDENYHRVAQEIVKLVKEIDKATNDSTITQISVSSLNSNVIDNIDVVVPVDSTQRYTINVYADSDSDSPYENFDFVAIFFGIILIFGTPIFIAVIICVAIVKIKKNSNQVLITSIEKGYKLPNDNNNTLSAKFQSGIKMIAWSVGIFMFFMVIDSMSMAVLALIPLIIGVGRLAAFYLDKKKESDSNSNNQPPFPPVNNNPENHHCDAV